MSWRGRLRSSSAASEMSLSDTDPSAFKLVLQESLLDPTIIQQFQKILKPMLAPIHDALKHSNLLVDSLRKQLKDKESEVADLRSEVQALKVSYDDLEQHGRRGSMRIFGMPEHTTGHVDDKVLSLINDHLQVTPPLVLDDIEVAHRLGKPPPPPFVPDPVPVHQASGGDASADVSSSPSTLPPPRAIIVKFASRRTKARVMRNKKLLKDNPFKAADDSTHTVYISDDLTKRRANLAYQARQLKSSDKIRDTWTYDCKILIKYTNGRISPIMNASDLDKYR